MRKIAESHQYQTLQCFDLLYSHPILHLHVNLKLQQSTTMVKINNLAATGGSKKGFEPFQRHISRQLSSSGLLGGSLEERPQLQGCHDLT